MCESVIDLVSRSSALDRAAITNINSLYFDVSERAIFSYGFKKRLALGEDVLPHPYSGVWN